MVFRLRGRASWRMAGLAGALFGAAALSGCASSGLGDMTAAIATGGGIFASHPTGAPLPITMFVASTRKEDRAGSKAGPDGMHFALNIVSVPPDHRPGRVEMPTFGRPSPERDFVLTTARPIAPSRFQNQIATYISGRVGADRDVLLYVHGFNTTEQDARFRLAQIVADGRFGGLPVLFTWPSKTNIFDYVSAKDSATASRDALEQLLWTLAQTPGVGRVHVLAHSMGTWLAMEALCENAIAGRPDLGGHLGDVMLAAPDIDLAVFRQQMARLGESAHVSIFVSTTDRALALSGQIAGERPRVGALNPSNPRDRAELQRLGVRVYDISHFSDGFINHGAYADAPAVVRTIGAHLAKPAAGEADTAAVLNAGADRASDPDLPGASVIPGAPVAAPEADHSGLVPKPLVSAQPPSYSVLTAPLPAPSQAPAADSGAAPAPGAQPAAAPAPAPVN